MKLVYCIVSSEGFYGCLLPALLSCDSDILSILDLENSDHE
uniref:Uncharacterized protein n=1 Tax=Dulem virus 194 TaxID=3145671 RepID=A0AAU8B8A4_9VIRU